jgi:CO/xanthine dehydrogenase Mo-binding subunit
MLHLKILFSDRPHARIVDIDTDRALQLPGVVAVLTADDVPVNEYGLAVADQPVLCDDVVRFEGDQVAVVIADSEDAASRARDLVEVVYEDLPFVTDARRAMERDSSLVHSDRDSNVLQHVRVRTGDVEDGFDAADVVVSDDYYLPMQEHAYLQPEAGLAYVDGDQVVVETAGQWAHHDQRQIAHALGLSKERVRVVYRAIGGAFGGREDISVQIVLALAAWKTGRPVKIVWSREESIRGHCKRHQMHIRARLGATRQGKLTAAEVEVIADAGAYAYTSTMVLGQVTLACTGVYEIPNVKVDSYAVYTNNIPAGAMRGFGGPQGVFVAELQMDRLAERLELDPVTLRERNLLSEDSLLSVGTPLPPGLDLHRMLEACASTAGWRRTGGGWRRPAIEPASTASHRRGSGLAIGFKNVGFSLGYPEDSTATVELHGGAEIEAAVVRYSGAECGQGTLTAIRQMAAEALGIAFAKVRLSETDTDAAPEAGSASASRLTMLAGNAVVGAAKEALALWRDEERPAVGTHTYEAPPTTDFDPETGHCKPNITFSPIAQAVDVEVDAETGEVTVSRLVTVVDVGKAVNPRLIEGQVEGAVAQGLGYTLMEDFVTKQGRTLTPSLSTYLVPTSMDLPDEVETVILENPEPIGPWGVRGVAEAPLLAVGPAVASAVREATGVAFTRLPLSPPAVLAGLLEWSEEGSV